MANIKRQVSEPVGKQSSERYTFSVSSLFFRQFGLPLAATLLSALLLLPEALLLLQGQRDPQGPRLLLLDPGAVQRVSALQRGLFCRETSAFGQSRYFSTYTFYLTRAKYETLSTRKMFRWHLNRAERSRNLIRLRTFFILHENILAAVKSSIRTSKRVSSIKKACT